MNLEKLKSLIRTKKRLLAFLIPIIMFFGFSIWCFCTPNIGNITLPMAESEAKNTESANYTVDFHYNDKEYNMQGNRSVKASEILQNLDISGTNIENVECSNNELFSASQENGEWVINSHAPFQTDEWMNVTIDGKLYSIAVTDTETEWRICNSSTNVTSLPTIRYSYNDTTKTLTIYTSDDITSVQEMVGNRFVYFYYKSWQDTGMNGQDQTDTLKSQVEHVVISGYVGNIYRELFSGWTALKDVTISDSANHLETIGISAFSGCTQLNSVALCNVKTIEAGAFSGCSSLTSLTIPVSVEKINTSVNIMNVVTPLAPFNGCTALGNLFIHKNVSLGTSTETGLVNPNTNIWRYSVTGSEVGKTYVAITSRDQGSGTSISCNSSMTAPYLIQNISTDNSLAGVTLIHANLGNTYNWSADNSTCTGVLSCSTCGIQGGSQTVNTTLQTTAQATCTQTGKIRYTASFSSPFSTQTKEFDTPIVADNHSWGAVQYAWANNNTKCTASRTCNYNAAHRQEQTVDTSSTVLQPATCTQKGSAKYTAVFTQYGFGSTETTGELPIDANNHNWGAVQYSWNEDKSQCTATITCTRDASHVQTETVNTTIQGQTDGTCSQKGTITYVANFTNPIFPSDTQTVDTDFDENNHDWGAVQYAWNDNKSQCTATRTCNRDASHKQEETTTDISSVTTPATCVANGKTVYTAKFHQYDFPDDTAEVGIPMTEDDHAWGATEYNWEKQADGSYKCTATRTCTIHNDVTRTSDTVVATQEVKVIATCTQQGKITYTADFGSEFFANGTKDENTAVDANNHDWNTTVNYDWSKQADGSYKCTATRTCKRNASHKDTETVTATIQSHTDATCETNGQTVYVANFTKAVFERQTNTVNIPATGHDWNEPEYTWNHNDETGVWSCKAIRTCKNNASHVDAEETVEAIAAISEPATCTQKGKHTYTATFNTAGFEEQSRTEEDIDELGHQWTITGVTQEVTDTTDGELSYVCDVCNETKTEVVPAFSNGTTKELSANVTVGENELKCILQDPYKVLPDGTVLDVDVMEKNSERWNELYQNLDGEHRIENIEFFEVSLYDAEGNKLPVPLDRKVRLLLPIPEGMDKEDLEAVLISNDDDIEFEEEVVTIDGVDYLAFWTDHFSPYALIDTLTDKELADLDSDDDDVVTPEEVKKYLEEQAAKTADNTSAAQNTEDAQEEQQQTSKSPYTVINSGDTSETYIVIAVLVLIADVIIYLAVFKRKKHAK